MNNMQFEEATQTFSGALFRSRDANQTVLGFRSTEFFDDTARDNKATSELDIKKTGGRIADTQDWYAELKNDGTKLSAGQAFSATGYSLGGHLATVFNLLNAGGCAAYECGQWGTSAVFFFLPKCYQKES